MKPPRNPAASILICGDDFFLIERAVKSHIAAFLAAESDFNLAQLDGSSTKPDEIMQSVQAAPFLGNRRLTVIRHADLGKLAALADQLDTIPETSQLIVAADKADKRTAAFKAFKAAGEVIEYSGLKPVELAGLIESEARANSWQIESRAAQLLADRVAGSSGRAISELTKLALFAAGQPITESMVREITARDAVESIFNLTDQLGARQARAMLATLHDLIDSGENIFYLLTMLARHVRSLLLIRASGPNPNPAELGLHPFVVKKGAAQARNFAEHELIRLLDAFKEIESGIKHGRIAGDDAALLELERALLAATAK